MRHLFFATVVLLGTVTCSFAQEQFRLDAPNAGASADAVLTENELVVVDQAGKRTVYVRHPQFDSQDGQWMGYFARNLNQVIRWPVARAGNMQIGDVAGGTVRYRTSQMVIQALNRAANRPVLPPPMNQGGFPGGIPGGQQFDPNIDPNFVDSLQGITPSPIFDSIYQGQEARSQMLQLATFDPRGSQLYLTRDNLSSLSLSRNPVADSNWWVVPTGSSYVRVQHYQNGRITALSATRNQTLALAPISQDPRQLWRVSSIASNRNRFVLENAMYSGQCMASSGGQLLLQPISYAPTQWWVPMSAPTLPNYEPFWRTVSQEVHANTALAPAQLGLINSNRTALVVLLADQRQAGKVQQIRIEPGQNATVTLDRDPGATIVETYEIRSPSGVWDRQQFTTAVPPRVFYDLSVYEEFLQSIAIDRTGKSPNPIEDVNYQPKSVGWLQIPPGAALPQNSNMDVLAQARSANNPGAVRRMDPKQFEFKPTSPTEAILNEFQSTPRKKF
ncbi:MAG: hypothetical protein SFV81_26040 [Pirellulaceae bacterium]|nr:hypothetical protein [Pirellulaceae bacterium]